MRRTHLMALGALLFSITAASLSHAQASRTWVSGVGDDVNPCSRTAPCKTFAGAISKTAAKGEITVLDPGGYGAVTITKSITLNGDGNTAGITSSGTNGIIVNTALTTDIVVLRNISINGTGTGLNGIRFLAGAQLVVDSVRVSGTTLAGIEVAHSGTGNLLVRNSTFTGGATGIKITSGNVNAALSDVSIQATTTGIDAGAGTVDVIDSVISHNSGFGVYAQLGAAIDLEGSMLTGNNVAAQAQTNSVIRISNTDFYNNLTGFGCGGGTLISAMNNRKANNIGGSVPVCAPTTTIAIQ